MVLVLGIAFAMVFGVVAIGRRVGAVGKVALVSLGLVAATWAAAVVVEGSGWKDTDGWIDCNDHCRGWQHVGVLLFWTPLLTGLLLLALLGALVARSLRRRT